MIELKYFIISCVVFLVILGIEFYHNMKLYREYKGMETALDLYIKRFGAQTFVITHEDER